ncbi:SAP domain-containing protein [Liquorilactobacillus capillatus]|uniref:SAP domain-containing protein n=1 Tax=Liquorilactobacillus capillatus DSM 19910 TaxID=1423731 RepID=A0A0R1M9U3_9LACO|nr:SAP domain-containing protein [Liquorilactobacillus capillatus]KRL00280.1 hypothetical protein FC81_GL000057 [Liquorilactobacillus capillatus DSM 19910]
MSNIAVPADLTEFKETYYYKTELVSLCRILKLPVSGTKAELNHYLEQYFTGIPSNEIKTRRPKTTRVSLTAQQITLKTRIVGAGFTFNNEARQFFANYFGVEKFSFKKEMAMIKRQAEQENDTSMTIADLIKRSTQLGNAKEQLATVAEEQTYQWNNFVRAFFQDPATKRYTERLKVAAILWRSVKKSKQEKIYTTVLLDVYATAIRNYLK